MKSILLFKLNSKRRGNMKYDLIERGRARSQSIKGIDYILGAFSPILAFAAIILFIAGLWKIGLALTLLILVILGRIFYKSYKVNLD